MVGDDHHFHAIVEREVVDAGTGVQASLAFAALSGRRRLLFRRA
jgi:hypothetical protein